MIFNLPYIFYIRLTLWIFIPLVSTFFVKDRLYIKYLVLLSTIGLFCVVLKRHLSVMAYLIWDLKGEEIFMTTTCLAIAMMLIVIVSFVTLVVLSSPGKLNFVIGLLEFGMLNTVASYICAYAYIDLENYYVPEGACTIVAYSTPDSIISSMSNWARIHITTGTVFAGVFFIALWRYYIVKKTQIMKRYTAQSKLRVLSSIEIVDLDEFSDFLPSAHEKLEEV